MPGIGELLKAERTKRGWTVADVHEATKISIQNLLALEDENFDSFANKVYARAFLRDYANYLGLDSAQLLQTYEDMTLAKVETSSTPSNKTSFALAFIVFLIALVVFTGIFCAMKGKGQFVKPAPKQQVTAQKPTPDESKSSAKPSESEDSKKPETNAQSDKAQKEVADPTQPAPVKESQAPETAPEAPKSDVIVNDNQLRITIAVTEKSWVQIWTDGKSTYVGTLLPGHSTDLVAKRTVKVLTGNAGGLKVRVDGVDQPALGRSGEVVTRTWRK